MGGKKAGAHSCWWEHAQESYRRTVVIPGGAQRGSRVPVLCPPQPHTDLERRWRDKAGDWSVSAPKRNLLGSGGGGWGRSQVRVPTKPPM